MTRIEELLYVVPAALIAVVGHEFAHGWVSWKLGDPTPKRDGRLSLNPLVHLDLFGTLCLIFFHFGWAKPVKINMYYYKDKRKGVLLTALAGPVMNLILAFAACLTVGGVLRVSGVYLSRYLYIFVRWLEYFAVLNTGLAVFNLIPVPPLDGSKVFGMLLHNDPEAFARRGSSIGYLIIVLLAVTGILSVPVNKAVQAVLWVMTRAAWFIFGLG